MARQASGISGSKCHRAAQGTPGPPRGWSTSASATPQFIMRGRPIRAARLRDARSTDTPPARVAAHAPRHGQQQRGQRVVGCDFQDLTRLFSRHRGIAVEQAPRMLQRRVDGSGRLIGAGHRLLSCHAGRAIDQHPPHTHLPTRNSRRTSGHCAGPTAPTTRSSRHATPRHTSRGIILCLNFPQFPLPSARHPLYLACSFNASPNARVRHYARLSNAAAAGRAERPPSHPCRHVSIRGGPAKV